MRDVSEEELIDLVTSVLHHCGPALNPERIDLTYARIRAGVIVRELKYRGFVVMQGNGPQPELALVRLNAG
jgi:hypothetical protein